MLMDLSLWTPTPDFTKYGFAGRNSSTIGKFKKELALNTACHYRAGDR